MSPLPLGILALAGAGGGAGAYDLLETTTLTSTTATVTFSGLGSYSDYKHLQVRMAVKNTDSGNSRALRCVLNADTSSSYRGHALTGNGSNVTSVDRGSLGYADVGQVKGSGTADAYTGLVLDILDFSNGNKNTTLRSIGGHYAGNTLITLASSAYFKTDAITSIDLSSLVGSLASGSRFSLYGIRGE